MLCLLKEAAPWLCALAAISTAQAADYPDHPVHVIVATSPGGTSDIFIRAMSDEFQKRAGQPIIVDTRSGGQMNIGGRACAEASGDGYTICFLPNETLVLNEFLFKNLSFNPAVDFRPITNPFFNVQVVVAGASLGVRSMAELATKSKERPATLGYSALSLPLQLFMEEWKAKTGADIVNVPMRGGGDAVTGVMTGTAPVAIVGIPNWLPYIRTGQANALAVNSQERSPLLPDAPTPAGVPVRITSPGCRVMRDDKCAICSAMVNSISPVSESCFTTSLTKVRILNACGFAISRAGTIQGPSGHAPSKFFCPIQS